MHRENRTFRAPGRVNLIGEHTDYNDGFVMPVAIDFSTWVKVSPFEERKLQIYSANFNDEIEVDLDDPSLAPRGHWSDYPVGVAVMLDKTGHRLRGARLQIRGEVPIGSGLSSSAAVEVATACALAANSGLNIEPRELALLCQRAENEFAGARVGIMDQFVSCLGRAGHALLLDCRSLEYKLIPIPENVHLVICNTMVKHEHASGAYNQRRDECDEGVRILSEWYPNARALRDISVEQLEQHSAAMPATIYKRCLHVVSENQRVLEGAKYLAAGDVGRFGSLMRESHRSLRDLFEVSCRELDIMVEIAESLEGYCGGRMTGGGFGGCTVNLVKSADASRFAAQISERYQAATGIKPDVYVCSAANGASAD